MLESENFGEAAKAAAAHTIYLFNLRLLTLSVFLLISRITRRKREDVRMGEREREKKEVLWIRPSLFIAIPAFLSFVGSASRMMEDGAARKGERVYEDVSVIG